MHVTGGSQRTSQHATAAGEPASGAVPRSPGQRFRVECHVLADKGGDEEVGVVVALLHAYGRLVALVCAHSFQRLGLQLHLQPEQDRTPSAASASHPCWRCPGLLQPRPGLAGPRRPGRSRSRTSRKLSAEPVSTSMGSCGAPARMSSTASCSAQVAQSSPAAPHAMAGAFSSGAAVLPPAQPHMPSSTCHASARHTAPHPSPLPGMHAQPTPCRPPARAPAPRPRSLRWRRPSPGSPGRLPR